MGSYITLIVSDDVHNAINYGLKEALSYLGQPDEIDCTFSGNMESYKLGLNLINHKMHKFSKTAIRRLVYAKRQHNTKKYIWKFHKTKAKRIFQTVRQEMKHKNNNDVKKLINDIYNFLCSNFNGDVKHSEIFCRAFIRDLEGRLVDPYFSNQEKRITKTIIDASYYNTRGSI